MHVEGVLLRMRTYLAMLGMRLQHTLKRPKPVVCKYTQGAGIPGACSDQFAVVYKSSDGRTLGRL